jgi:hypothetical protein
MIPSIIELLYSKNINTINKFNTYKIIKEVYGNDKKQTFTYYKANILYNKLLETKILIPTNEKGVYKFNKIVEHKPIVIYFD